MAAFFFFLILFSGTRANTVCLKRKFMTNSSYCNNPRLAVQIMTKRQNAAQYNILLVYNIHARRF